MEKNRDFLSAFVRAEGLTGAVSNKLNYCAEKKKDEWDLLFADLL